MGAAPRSVAGAIIFRDLVGKLDTVQVECERCGRSGSYRLDRLISQYGLDTKLFEWTDELTVDPQAALRDNQDENLAPVLGRREGVARPKAWHRRARPDRDQTVREDLLLIDDRR